MRLTCVAVNMPHLVSIRAALLLILVAAATSACGGSKNNGTASSGAMGSSGSSGSSGSGSGAESATEGGLGPPGPGGCVLGAQAIDYSGCTECAVCWQQYCCQQSNDCLNDPTCNALLACQSNCYNGQAPDGGAIDVDASTELPDGGELDDPDYCAYTTCLPGGDGGTLYNAQQDCLNMLNMACTTACTCP
jgi:hypothetical protein